MNDSDDIVTARQAGHQLARDTRLLAHRRHDDRHGDLRDRAKHHQLRRPRRRSGSGCRTGRGDGRSSCAQTTRVPESSTSTARWRRGTRRAAASASDCRCPPVDGPSDRGLRAGTRNHDRDVEVDAAAVTGARVTEGTVRTRSSGAVAARPLPGEDSLRRRGGRHRRRRAGGGVRRHRRSRTRPRAASAASACGLGRRAARRRAARSRCSTPATGSWRPREEPQSRWRASTSTLDTLQWTGVGNVTAALGLADAERFGCHLLRPPGQRHRRLPDAPKPRFPEPSRCARPPPGHGQRRHYRRPPRAGWISQLPQKRLQIAFWGNTRA